MRLIDKLRRRHELRVSATRADVQAFVNERRQHMNDEMERRNLQLPDPADAVPTDWRELPDEHKFALYCETWATLGANIAYLNDESRRPEWVQDPLPLAEFYPWLTVTAAAGWCAPSESELVEVSLEDQ